jgi:hypothetical protein
VKRSEPLRALRWGVRKAPREPSWRDQYMPGRRAPAEPKYTAFELAWFAFVRTLPCCASLLSRDSRCWGPMQAAHLALNANQKGTGMKVPHDQTAPLCQRHHEDFDQHKGVFAEWSRDRRYDWAGDVVANVRRASTPEDRSQADYLADLGIGVVIGDGTPTGFRWLPGSFGEVGATGIAAAGERLIGAWDGACPSHALGGTP